MKNTPCKQTFRMYTLEPGDYTRYTLGLAATLEPPIGQVISGIGDGSRYFILLIMTGYSTGVAVLSKHMVDDLQPHDLGYAQSHGMGSVNTYTLAACMLAAGVLIQEPEDIDGACQAMLRAPDILSHD